MALGLAQCGGSPVEETFLLRSLPLHFSITLAMTTRLIPLPRYGSTGDEKGCLGSPSLVFTLCIVYPAARQARSFAVSARSFAVPAVPAAVFQPSELPVYFSAIFCAIRLLPTFISNVHAYNSTVRSSFDAYNCS